MEPELPSVPVGSLPASFAPDDFWCPTSQRASQQAPGQLLSSPLREPRRSMKPPPLPPCFCSEAFTSERQPSLDSALGRPWLRLRLPVFLAPSQQEEAPTSPRATGLLPAWLPQLERLAASEGRNDSTFPAQEERSVPISKFPIPFSQSQAVHVLSLSGTRGNLPASSPKPSPSLSLPLCLTPRSGTTRHQAISLPLSLSLAPKDNLPQPHIKLPIPLSLLATFSLSLLHFTSHSMHEGGCNSCVYGSSSHLPHAFYPRLSQLPSPPRSSRLP